MPNTKDLTTDGPIKVLAVGKSGTRKSTVGASFPKPIYHMDFDMRINALRGFDLDYDQFPQIAGWGRPEKKFLSILDEIKKGTFRYKTVHIASITSLLDFWLAEAVSHYENANEKSGLRIERKGAKPKLMRDMPHYKHVHACYDELIADYINPIATVCNVYVEAHEIPVFDDDGDIVGDRILATPTLAERIPTTFDETWQFKFKRDGDPRKGGMYYVHFRDNYLAKTTFRQLPNVVEITNKEAVFYDEIFLPNVNKKEN